ncbi:M23 family metallopeptidase [Streptomyces sp. NPDC051940]|uniref:M23 family metallopeptidase n=1 Tax=Streptomyces sp. NPDC051940 TaxID=3155675 RepID=UPI003412E306
MASNRPGPGASYDDYVYDGESYEETGSWAREEWAPGQDDLRPTRGRRRAPKQTRGSVARSGAVLGVGVFAAVGASSMAQAQSKPPVAISMPEPVADVAHGISSSLPEAESLPGVGSLFSDEDDAPETTTTTTTPLVQTGLATDDGEQTTADTGEALRARILEQAAQQQAEADAAELAALEQAAAEKAAEEAAQAKADAEAEAKRLEEEARKKAEEEARQKAEAERLAKLAASYIAPLSSYTITSTFGQAGDMWSSGYHTGLDFAASTGTPVYAVHGGTITSAGWAGSYGYQIIVTLDDGTEVWYNHLSSILKSSGEVTTGDMIGRVGATGNVTGPHLHLEVRPDGGSPIDPMTWLRNHGATV